MLLALGIVCLVGLGATLIARFVLRLDFRSKPESLGTDATPEASRGCYDNWAAHRACPQGLPSTAADNDQRATRTRRA